MNAYAFNLVPESYQQRQRTIAIVKRTAFVLVGLLLLSALIAGYLKYKSETFEEVLSTLEHDQVAAMRAQKELDSLNEQLSLLQRHEKLLLGLRSGVDVPIMMQGIEDSLPVGKVWLTRWQFVRSGIVTESQPDPRPPSYFVRLESPEPVSNWQALTHMSINGEASDHQALSTFTKRLLNEEGVADVTVQRTALRTQRGTGVSTTDPISFEVRVLVRTEVAP